MKTFYNDLIQITGKYIILYGGKVLVREHIESIDYFSIASEPVKKEGNQTAAIIFNTISGDTHNVYSTLSVAEAIVSEIIDWLILEEKNEKK